MYTCCVCSGWIWNPACIVICMYVRTRNIDMCLVCVMGMCILTAPQKPAFFIYIFFFRTASCQMPMSAWSWMYLWDLRSTLCDLTSCTRPGGSSHRFFTTLRRTSQSPSPTNMEGMSSSSLLALPVVARVLQVTLVCVLVQYGLFRVCLQGSLVTSVAWFGFAVSALVGCCFFLSLSLSLSPFCFSLSLSHPPSPSLLWVPLILSSL